MNHTINSGKRIIYFLHRSDVLIVVLLTVLALGLRLWRLDAVPPGWRDDELINSLVISQKVLDGQWAVYYPDASGHEALYHVLNAAMLAVFGPGLPGIRWLSVILGALTVPLTYLLGKYWWGKPAGLAAATMLAFSFWSLMYSRIGIRHILLPVLALPTFYSFWRGLETDKTQARIGSSKTRFRLDASFTPFLWAALFMGAGFYTYFAARGVPLILLAFCGYLWLVKRDLIGRRWRQLALMFAVSSFMALPLIVTLSRQPESEARVAELAVPLVEARDGNYDPLWQHMVVTLSMTHGDGDSEWLYNIPHRPVFGPIGALFFWFGVAIALWYALKPLFSALNRDGRRRRPSVATSTMDASLASAFLLLWWLAGIAPAFISVPPASLGHTILAQSAVFILAAVPVWWVGKRWQQTTDSGYRSGPFRWPSSWYRGPVMGLLGLVLVVSVAGRDLPDYFREWPQRGMVRFLYRADVREVAGYLNQQRELVDFGITGLLAGPWDKIALRLDLDEGRQTAVRPRWYNPARALLLSPSLSFSDFPRIPFAYPDSYTPVPGQDGVGGYRLSRVDMPMDTTAPVCFRNGLCWLSAAYDRDSQRLELGWQVKRPLDLPRRPLISNPPPPGVYAGARLRVFGQLHDAAGFLAGDDGLWVDPATLHPGDVFVQQHWPNLPEGSQPVAAVFGLYDPMTGERILTEDGRDHLHIELGERRGH